MTTLGHMKNTDMMLIMGVILRENLPGIQVPSSQAPRNAKIISVTRASHAHPRSRSLLPDSRRHRHRLLGGVIHYAIENNRIAKDYLVNFTNAAFIIKPGFQLPGDTDGVFSASTPRRIRTTSPRGIMRAPPVRAKQKWLRLPLIPNRLRRRRLWRCRNHSLTISRCKPQLCLSASEEALQSLHARDVERITGNSQRTIPQSR